MENPEAYQLIATGLDQFPDLLSLLQENPDELTLIDLPGKLDDDGLMAVFRSADLVLCPFCYDEFSFQSTVLFLEVLQKINLEVQIVYIPNRVKANVLYETKQEVDEQLSQFGELTQ